MKCKFPVYINRKKNHALRPCGGCLPCLISERRVKTHRLLLESYLHESNCFVTLTFSNENLPSCGVSVAEHQCFIKNLREQWHHATGRYFRMYGVGEYGEKTGRPHYHYILFNFPTCVGSGPTWHGNVFLQCNCHICSFVAKVWGKGHVFLGTATVESMQYVAGYVTKKMTKKDTNRFTPVAFNGECYQKVFPEFAKGSTRPGLAAGFVPLLLDKFYASQLNELPTTLNHNGRIMPLGRYLKGKLNEEIGQAPLTQIQMESSQMLHMLKRAKNAIQNPDIIANCQSLEVAMRLINQQEVLQIEQRYYRKKGSTHEI